MRKYHKKVRSTARGRAAHNEASRRYYEKQLRENLPELRTKQRNNHLKTKYDIDLNQFAALLAAQKGKCPICGCRLTLGDRPMKSTTAVVDHNHKTGKIRGIICNRNNQGLGKFKDNPKQLRQAADYLEKLR